MFRGVPILILNKIPSDSLSISFQKYVQFYQTQMTGGQEQNIIRTVETAGCSSGFHPRAMALPTPLVTFKPGSRIWRMR